MTRISTYGQMSSTLTSVMRLQSSLAEATTQEASGAKSADYQGLGSDTRLLLNLENQLTRSVEYVDQADIVAARVQAMYSAVDNMVEVLTGYATTLTTALGGSNAAVDASLNYQSEVKMASFTDSLNTQVDNRYLFSGDMTDTAPINVEDPPYAPQTYPSVVNTDYYQGDSSVATFKASDGLTFSYGVTADDSAFEKAIRAMSLGMNASEDPVDTDAVVEAFDLVSEALEEISVIQTRLSAVATAIEEQADIQTEVQLQLEAMVSNIQDVDLAEALTRMETLQTQLKASYSAISIVNEMNLFDYL